MGVGFEAAKAEIKRKVTPKFQWTERKKAVYGGKGSRETGTRKMAVLLAQLRSGHCAKTPYYRKRIGLTKDGKCVKCGEEEEKDHWFVCPALQQLRQRKGVYDLSVARDDQAMSYFIQQAYLEWC